VERLTEQMRETFTMHAEYLRLLRERDRAVVPGPDIGDLTS
jgi:hypothetical protein